MIFLNLSVVSAEKSTTSEDEINVEVNQEVHEDGTIHAEIVTDSEIAEVIYNPETGETYLNGELIDMTVEKNSNHEISPFAHDGGCGGSGLVSVGTYKYNVPIGSTIAIAAGLITIWTGVPASRITQSLILLVGGPASTKLNKLLQTETKQYRTSKKVQEPGMCFPQYKYINNNRYIFNGKTSSWSGLGAYYLTSKLC